MKSQRVHAGVRAALHHALLSAFQIHRRRRASGPKQTEANVLLSGLKARWVTAVSVLKDFTSRPLAASHTAPFVQTGRSQQPAVRAEDGDADQTVVAAERLLRLTGGYFPEVTLPSMPPATTVWPSGLKATIETVFARPCRVRTALPLATSHKTIVPSKLRKRAARRPD